MTQRTELGTNRTGIATCPRLSEEMIAGTAEFPPDAPGDERKLASDRALHAKRSERLGSVPPPPTAEALRSTLGTLRLQSPVQLVDKLGERLAFARMCVRMYEALLAKFDSRGGFAHGPTRRDLEAIMLEEFAHFRMLEESIAQVGADPTVLTPSADLQATLSRGLMDVLVDARTTFSQCLEAVLVAELIDNDSWTVLAVLAEQAGHEALAARFQQAVSDEGEHLRNVRRWLAIAQGRVRPESSHAVP